VKIFENLYMVGSGVEGMFITSLNDCNTYLLDCGNGQLIMIDAGAEVGMESIFHVIESHGLSRDNISAVFLTHIHYDHVSGCGALRDIGTRIFSPEVEAGLLESGSEDLVGHTMAKRAGRIPRDSVYPHSKVDRVLKDGDVLTFGELNITVIHTPGHSVNSTCYMVDGGDRRLLFSGDSFFLNGRIGLLNHEGSSLEGYRKSAPKLKDLGIEGLFPGHFRFVARNGQKHIDMFIEALELGSMPKGWDAGLFG